jgi:uncharacterized membrane protein
MTLESNKSLGGVGAILVLIGSVAFFGIPYVGIIGLIGVILILVALHGLGSYYNDGGIFRYALYGLITAVVGVIVTAGVAVIAVLTNLSNIKDFISTIYPTWDGNWSSLSGLTPNLSNINPSDLVPFITGILAALIAILIVVWIFAIISSFLAWKSLKQLAEKSKVGLFGTAGLLLLIGAFLLIVIGLGAILMWIAALVLAIAFFSMKPQEQPMAPAASPPPPA